MLPGVWMLACVSVVVSLGASHPCDVPWSCVSDCVSARVPVLCLRDPPALRLSPALPSRRFKRNRNAIHRTISQSNATAPDCSGMPPSKGGGGAGGGTTTSTPGGPHPPPGTNLTKSAKSISVPVSSSSSTHSRRRDQDEGRTKVVVRRAPPELPEDVFWKSIAGIVGEGDVDWKVVSEGGPSGGDVAKERGAESEESCWTDVCAGRWYWHLAVQGRTTKEDRIRVSVGRLWSGHTRQSFQNPRAAHCHSFNSVSRLTSPSFRPIHSHFPSFVSRNPSSQTKAEINSVAYLHFKRREQVLKFAQAYQGHAFRDKQGGWH